MDEHDVLHNKVAGLSAAMRALEESKKKLEVVLSWLILALTLWQGDREEDLRRWQDESGRLTDKSSSLAAQLAALAAEKEALAAAASIGAGGDPEALHRQEDAFRYRRHERWLSSYRMNRKRQRELEGQLAETNDTLKFLKEAAKAEETRWEEKNKEYEGAVAAVAYLQTKCQELSEQVRCSTKLRLTRRQVYDLKEENQALKVKLRRYEQVRPTSAPDCL